MQTVLGYLEIGQNIFVSDVDSIWAKYQNLDEFKDFQVYHGSGSLHPIEIWTQVGFVLCGCIAGVRSSLDTIKLFETLVDRCSTSCDDQRIINHVYLDEYKMNWTQVTTNDGNAKRRFKYEGTSTAGGNLNISVFDPSFVSRPKRYPENACTELDNSWIISPISAKTQSSKLKVYDRYSECLEPETITVLQNKIRSRG